MNAVIENVSVDSLDKQAIYDRLMKASTGFKNDHILATMLASSCVGEGNMPARLGLRAMEYETLMAAHFPMVSLPLSFMAEQTDLAERQDEAEELSVLLSTHALDETEETHWMANILVAGCMGGSHLWEDMGFWSRKDLSKMIQDNFPELAKKNDKDMKWKKFFYKQLCIAEGISVCRSPSCEVCPDYSDCFSPEE